MALLNFYQARADGRYSRIRRPFWSLVEKNDHRVEIVTEEAFAAEEAVSAEEAFAAEEAVSSKLTEYELRQAKKKENNIFYQ